ncbi:MAG: endolytic transglycosylase MltG [Candidatus Pacebacteria bacterium]|nr:endolytic transglycosylase MltG [Candidatus Paceibacterota bacterium]
MNETPIHTAWDTFREYRDAFYAHWNDGINRRTIAVVLAIIAPVLIAYITLISAPSDFPVDGIVSVSKENTLAEVAIELESQKVVRSAGALEAVVRIMGGARSVHAGDYQFHQSQNTISVARAIMYGYYGLEPLRIRIPEGTTVEAMAPLLAKKLPRFDAAAFIAAAKPMEGYYYPDTYFFLPNADTETVLKTLRDTFDERVAPLMPQIEASGHTLHEIVTMASLLELEAHIYNDKRMISGLLWHRLDINMPLQVDAAFLYFLGKSTFSLTLKDLQYDSPYNTYKYKGLPPGPITNPSLRSIQAAVDPIENTYVFYLADNNGVTYFSKTYEEHLRKKRLYLGT